MPTPEEAARPAAYSGISTFEPPPEVSRPEWTPNRVQKAFQDCAQGQLKSVADLCDAVQTDGRIRGVLQTRTNALIGTPLSFDAVAPRRQKRNPSAYTKNAVTQALEEGGEWWTIVPEPTFVQIMLWGLLLNFAVAEIVWRYDTPTDLWIPTLHVKHPRHIRYDISLRKFFLMIGSPTSGGMTTEEIEIVPGDGRWFVYSPFGGAYPWMNGLIWPLAYIWLAKQYAEYDWGRRNEARGRAALIGTTPQGALDSDRAQFAKDIAALRTRLGMAIPHGYTVQAVEFGQADHETFALKVANADAAVAILLLGQNLTTEVKSGGSYAAGKSAERVRQDFLEWDAEVASTGFRSGVLVHYARIRFDDEALAPYPSWNTTPPEVVGAWANVVARAAEALDKLIGRGLDVDVAEFCKRAGIPLKSATVSPPKKVKDARQ
jgi:phage gp29-like protein